MTYSGFRRMPVAGPARQNASLRSFLAPVKGWVTAANLANAKPGQALVLENWFPSETGIAPRAGRALQATIGDGDPVERLFHYTGQTSKLFAANETAIYDITSPVDPEVSPDPAVEGQTSGYYSSSLFTTSGGTFLTVVNGVDPLLRFDGTDWFPITENAILALPYDGGTVAFTAGDTVTGGTSSETAEIVKVVGGSVTGVLWIRDPSGAFDDDEVLTNGAGGAAVADLPSPEETLAPAITGVDTDKLSHVWNYRNRMFFIQGGTLKAHYLPVDSIAGTLGTRSFGGIFQRGGSLLFGATWSLDAGDGIDDKCVFVTDQGEMAIFQGSNPDGTDPGDFDLVGRYDITIPMGKNCTMSAGGDLLVLTEDGIVPVSAAINKDAAALSLSAVTRPIEPEWQREVRNRGGATPWEIAKWPSHNMAVVSVPRPSENDDAYCFVVNIETGAWCKYTNWDVRCLDVFADKLFFGALNGEVWQGETTGADGDETILCTYVGHADHLGSPGRTKTARSMRATFKSTQPFKPKLSASTDYNVTVPSPPSVEMISGVGWDLSAWDVGRWDDPSPPAFIRTRWVSIGRTGFAFNPQIQVSSNSAVPLRVDLVAFDMTYENGGVQV